MNKKSILGVLLFSFALMTALPARARAASDVSGAASATLDNVPDILSGRRTLFPVDDLLFNYADKDGNAWSVTAPTSGGKIASITRNGKCGFALPDTYVSGIGHMFNQPQAVQLSMTSTTFRITQRDGSECGEYLNFRNPLSASPRSGQFPQGDFNGDGYADFVALVNNRPYLITAKDVNKPADGLLVGGPDSVVYPDATIMALAVSDFDGDGKDELAMVTVLADNETIAVDIYDEQPVSGGSFKLVSIGNMQFASGSTSPIWQIYATAGPYTGIVNPTTGYQEAGLLIAYGVTDGKPLGQGHMVLASVSATVASAEQPALTLTLAQQLSQPSGVGPNIVGLQSANLDFFEPTSQVVLATFSGLSITNSLAVVTLSPDSSINVASTIDYPALVGLDIVIQAGIAIGNFAQPSDPHHPLALQIASLNVLSLGDSTTDATAWLAIFEVDPARDFALSGPNKAGDPLDPHKGTRTGSFHHLVGPSYSGLLWPTMSLSAGDLQGRSLLLGEPTKITATHEQPTVVVGMPPMHVDWIAPVTSPGNDNPAPEVLNVSALMSGFYTGFQTSDSSSINSSTQSRTSFTNAVQTSASAGYTWGGSETGSVSVDATVSAGYLHNKTVKKYKSNYRAQTSTLTTQTGNDDEVFSTTVDQNIYTYPVIGQTACPVGKPNCATSERLPLTMVFYGPDNVQNNSAAGATQEWFQPIWQPDQIFSYPWSQDELLAQASEEIPNGSPSVLTSSKNFSTSVAKTTETASWSSGSSSDATTGTMNNINWGTSISVTVKPSAIGGVSANASASYNGSLGMSTMNTQSTALTASSGISVFYSGRAADSAAYGYTVYPFVLGNSDLKGMYDTSEPVIPVDCVPGGSKPCGSPDVKSIGPLQAVFAANPVADGEGSWWQGAYTLPDISLNHPIRWSLSTANMIGTTVPANCLQLTTDALTMSCAKFNAPDVSDKGLWNSDGLWMKGLLITPGGAAALGPQITQANAGDPVHIEARVYNYSLADMPAGSQVVVQFYGQQMDPGTNEPVNPATGEDYPSFLIENVAVGPLRGFANSDDTPNWEVAATDQLDTAAHAGEDLIFWVLVVPKDAQGLVAEMPGHGLTGIPPTVGGMAEAASWIEPYSNNLGYYHLKFHINPASGPGAPKARATVVAPLFEDFVADPSSIAVNEKASVSAMLRVDGTQLEGVQVNFYDGDPANDGRQFESETITHMDDGKNYEVRVPYRVKSCGTHTLYAQVESVVEPLTTTLIVPGDPLPTVQEMIDTTQGLSMRAGDRQHLVNLLLDTQQALAAPDASAAMTALGRYHDEVGSMSGNMIPTADADALATKTDLVKSCVAAAQ